MDPNARLLRQAGLVSSTAGRPGEIQEAQLSTPRGTARDPGAKKTLRVLTIDLSTARTVNGSGTAAPLDLSLVGNCLAVMDGAYTTTTASIQLNQEGDYLPIGPGAALYGFPFDSIRLINSAQTSGYITLVYFTDYPNDRSLLRYR